MRGSYPAREEGLMIGCNAFSGRVAECEVGEQVALIYYFLADPMDVSIEMIAQCGSRMERSGG